MMKLNVSNIQHFSVGDGPGIRTTVFLKGCNLRCPWCHNPETVSPESQELFFEKSGNRIRYGMWKTVDEIMDEVTEDEDFYRASGGGVTVSGGEPLLQSVAVAELLSALKARGIATLIDTAGDVPWGSLARVKDVTDMFFYDFKTGSEDQYSAVIGGNGARIFENLCRLITEGCTVHVRIPLIPGFNTSDEETGEICRKLIAAGVSWVDLLPFHRLGSAKYEALGKTYAYQDTEPQTQKEIETNAEIYRKYFQVTVEM